MTNKRIVEVIPPKIKYNLTSTSEQPKKRVAAYARVSTDNEEQLTSYNAQVSFYTNLIKSNPDWEFVGVYTDEGISGTNTKKRKGFNEMIRDALNGKIDLIITKSVSRFARNTVDSLVTIRQLKEKGVEVYFEKENIHTLDAKGEVLLTIMSSLAQEESRSISENVTWGKRKRAAEGRINLPYKSFLGYTKGEDGLPKIVEKEAEIIRQIYQLFLEGKTIRTIAETLTAQTIPTPRGKTKWSVSSIQSILQNEKYKGCALLQKTFTVDFLSKKTKTNEGEVPQYFVKDSHPAIIDPETFDLVQVEIKKRSAIRHKIGGSSPFSAKIICGECGGFYGSKVWHSKDQHRTHIWQCNQKYKKQTFCSTPHLKEEVFKQAFNQAFNQILTNKETHIKRLEELLPALADNTELLAKQEKFFCEQKAIEDSLHKCIEENARVPQNQEEYNQRYNAMCDRLKSLNVEITSISEKTLNRAARHEKVRQALDILRRNDRFITEFEEELWFSTVDSITVHATGQMSIRFRDGSSMETEKTFPN